MNRAPIIVCFKGLCRDLCVSISLIFFGTIMSDATQIPTSIVLELGTLRQLHIGKEGFDDIFLVDPKVADVDPKGIDVIYLYGKSIGHTQIILGRQDGKGRSKQVSITVTHKISEINSAINRAVPGANITASSTDHGVLLQGVVASPKHAADIVNIVGMYVNSGEILNQMSVQTPTQVMLRVKIAEVNKTALDKFDINWSNLFQATKGSGAFNFGVFKGRTPLANGAFSSGGLEKAFGGSFSDGKASISTVIDLLESHQLSRTLAEPTLITTSGKKASFLAGGEFPFPQAGGTSGGTTFKLKEFGIKLDFTPTVLSANHISLEVAPEVSAINIGGGAVISLSDGQTTTMPAITTNKTQTTVELASGQSLVIAGLFKNDISSVLKEIPGLSKIPILGALFRSKEFEKKESELVIILTPHLIEPLNSEKSLMMPDDGLRVSGKKHLLEREINEGVDVRKQVTVEMNRPKRSHLSWTPPSDKSSKKSAVGKALKTQSATHLNVPQQKPLRRFEDVMREKQG